LLQKISNIYKHYSYFSLMQTTVYQRLTFPVYLAQKHAQNMEAKWKERASIVSFKPGEHSGTGCRQTWANKSAKVTEEAGY
jgi:hypothetical protein